MAGRNGTCLEIAEHEGHFHLIEFMRDWEAWHRKDGQVIAPPVTDHSMLSLPSGPTKRTR